MVLWWLSLSSSELRTPKNTRRWDQAEVQENVVSELNGDVAQKEPNANICGCDEKYAVTFILSATSISGFLFRDRAPPAASENADAGRDRPAQSERERR